MTTSTPEMTNLVDAYQKAIDAWAAVPKIAMLVDRNEEAETDRYYCGECGKDFYTGPAGWSRPSWTMPLFCCGKLML